MCNLQPGRIPAKTNVMRILFTCTILLSALSCFAQQPLFRIIQQGKIGYMDKKGKVVIPAIYLNGTDFSEGLAAVRHNGYYGYIDMSGNFVIPPRYDKANGFYRGIALAYKKGEPVFINKAGQPVLPPVYKGLSFIDDRRVRVTTLTGKQGVLNLGNGRLLVDTVFEAIGDFQEGAAIARLRTEGENKEKLMAVIDTLGRFIVKPGKYSEIEPFSEGYAVVEIEGKNEDDDNYEGVIDTKGNLLFARNVDNSWLDGEFHDGLIRVNLYDKNPPKEKGISYSSSNSYEGFINPRGEVVLDTPAYKNVKDFSGGRAFVENRNGEYILIDRSFRSISSQTFFNIEPGFFIDGYAIVETHEGTGIIDTMGRFIVPPKYYDINDISVSDGVFFFAEEDEDDDDKYGIADLQGNVLLKAVMQEFDRSGFWNGLLKATIDGKLTYIDRNGTIVWQQQEDKQEKMLSLNVDFMVRGYFHAYSTPQSGEYSNGWSVSRNVPEKITGMEPFPPNTFSMVIDTSSVDTFAHRYYGYKLYVSNATGNTVHFNAQDSRLYLKLQARNESGEWKDIEYLPSSWCGNSYHELQLEPNAYWSFTIPRYTGEMKTLVRAELRYKDGKDSHKEKFLYSNVIPASINPGQFWNKLEYRPQGIMDPYWE